MSKGNTGALGGVLNNIVNFLGAVARSGAQYESGRQVDIYIGLDNRSFAVNSTMNIEQHISYMSMALEESKKGLPNCLPNPPVGCVLVRDGVVVSTGYTREPGNHHAEADALQNCAGSLEDVSAYVTLEPCSFHGRTPSCARALIKRNIGHVYVAIKDPDPRNRGKGIALLKNAGVKVTENILFEPVSQYLAPYLYKS